MNEKLTDIKINTAVLFERVNEYRQGLKGDIYYVYQELSIILNDILRELKKYEKVNFLTIETLRKMYNYLFVMFKIFTPSHLKIDCYNLILDIYTILQESDKK